MVFFCTGVQGLRIVDASNPQGIRPVAQISSSLSHPQFPRCQHVAVDEDTVYVTNKGDDIQPIPFISEVSLKGTPKEIATYQNSSFTFEGIVAKDGLIFATLHKKGIGILRLTEQNFQELAFLEEGFENAWAADIVDNTLYIADGLGGLVTVDVSNPETPHIIGCEDHGDSNETHTPKPI